jgi:predicted DsbA family dithiol-disulfide isomerase
VKPRCEERPALKIVYFLDVLSSWCLIADDALVRLRAEMGGALAYEWKIAALRDPLAYTNDQLSWYYRRTEAVTGVRLNPVWLRSTADGTRFSNLAAEAARSLGCTDDRVRLAIARGVMLEGKEGGRRDVVAEIAAAAGGLDRAALERAMDDPATEARIRASSQEFAELHVGVRPTFVLSNDIGDTSVLSGCWRYDLLAETVRALRDDAAVYHRFTTENPGPPGTH